MAVRWRNLANCPNILSTWFFKNKKWNEAVLASSVCIKGWCNNYQDLLQVFQDDLFILVPGRVWIDPHHNPEGPRQRLHRTNICRRQCDPSRLAVCQSVWGIALEILPRDSRLSLCLLSEACLPASSSYPPASRLLLLPVPALFRALRSAAVSSLRAP